MENRKEIPLNNRVGVVFAGGFGNQLFQIAAVLSIAKENNATPVLNFDINATPNSSHFHPPSKYRNSFFKKLLQFHQDPFPPTCIYADNNTIYQKIPFTPDMVIAGWYQSEMYFNTIKENIRDYFNFEEERISRVCKFLQNISNGHRTVGIHVRRGDYVAENNKEVFGVVTLDYYQQAQKKLQEKYGNLTVIVVTDDKTFCEEHFPNCIISPFVEELDDFTLLASTNDVIIANSTFSWWAAYLNDSHNKTVIAPKIWFGGKSEEEYQDIVPQHWIKL